MSFSRVLNKADIYTEDNPLDHPYANPSFPDTVTSLGEAVNYMASSIFPNARPSVATELLLPTGIDTPTLGDAVPELNDYRIALDYNNTSQAAGFRYTQLEGQATPQWNLIQLFDSQDSILQQWETDAAGIFALLLGVPDVAGQTLYGSSLANGDLTLSANSGDGTNDPALQTGHIKLFGDTKPTSDNVFDLGAAGERFASLYLSGDISDGTNALSVLEALTAYNHSQIITSNPHSVAYAELGSSLGNVTIQGDVGTLVVDFSTGGNKSFTLAITDDSHNHTTSTITDFADASWAALKGSLTDGGGISWTFNDILKTATAAVSIDTSFITDIASPAADRILTGNVAGNAWRQSTGAVELTGDISGSGVYNSTTDKVSLAATVDNMAIENLDRLNISNLSASVAADNPATITQNNHGLITGRKIRLFGTTLDSEYVITVVDLNNYTVGLDNSAGAVEVGYIIPDGSQFMYDTAANEWQVKLEFSQIAHNEISDLLLDDHTQYNLINGRTDGTTNKVTGGEIASGNLYLSSTSHATKGNILFEDNLEPATGATYSGGWSGTDIGSTSTRIRDLFMYGVISNLRPETVGSLPAATVQDKGRIVLLNGGEFYGTTDGITYKRFEDGSNKDQPNGYAPLDASAKLPMNNIPDALIGAVVYQGTWNAATNTPTLASGVGTKGHYYAVSVTGSTVIDGISDWVTKDVIIYNGTAWEKIDNTDRNVYTKETLLDNTATQAMTLTIDELLSPAAVIEYYVTRGSNIQYGRLLISDASPFQVNHIEKLGDAGVTFTVSEAAGIGTLEYTTTADVAGLIRYKYYKFEV